jgi:hypothetical protein
MAEPANPANPQSQGAGGDGDKSKLFFGKYKTIEEAETGYKELERSFHTNTTELAGLRRTIEERIPERNSSGYSHDGTTNPTYVPTDPNVAGQVLANFYADPVGTLVAVKEAAKKELREETRRESESANQHRSRVAAWASQNQDVLVHGDLLDYHVRQTDPRLAIETRLEDAAKKVRTRVAELKGSNPNQGPIIEAPSHGNAVPASPAAPAATTQGGETVLAGYAAERNRASRKPLGVMGRK